MLSLLSRCKTPTLIAAAQIGVIGLSFGLLSSCTSTKSEVVVSVKDQKLGLYSEGKLVKRYAISTSKFGVGDKPGSNCTPLGKCEVVAKIGHGLPPGAVLKSRSWNGEVLKPDAPGRDPIVSRILWLKGLESNNKNAYKRYIYIHGTPEERTLGQPASYGCIRMGMKDVVSVFNDIGIGAKVVITKGGLPHGKKGEAVEAEVVEATALAAVDTAPADAKAAAPETGSKSKHKIDKAAPVPAVDEKIAKSRKEAPKSQKVFSATAKRPVLKSKEHS